MLGIKSIRVAESAIIILLCCFPFLFHVHAAGLLVKGDYKYPPYEFLDENGQPSGFNVDITRAVAREMGMDIRIVLGPWNQVRQELESGKIDALMGMFNTPERDKKVDFSIPHFIASYAVFVRAGSPIKSLDQARGKTILVQEGDLGHDYIREKQLTPDIVSKINIGDVLSLLADGKGDCAVVSRLQGLILIKEKHIKNVVAVGEPIIQRKYCLAVKEGNSSLLAKLNEGLSLLKTSGEYDRIYEKWFGVYEQQNTIIRVARYIAFVAGPLLVLAVGFFIWSRMLKKQVALKTGELRQALQQIDDILISMPTVVISLERNGRVRHWNPKAEARTGISKSEAVGRRIDGLTTHPVITKDCVREVLETGTPFRQSRVSYNTGTELRFEDITVYALSERQGVVIHAEDVTEQVRMEEMMIQSEKMMSLGGMAAGIAHEINNPLAGMIQTAELLNSILVKDLEKESRDGWEVSQIRQFMAAQKIPKLLSNIRSAGQKAATIVSNMLAFAGQDNDRTVRCRIPGILDEAMNLARSTHLPQADDKKWDIECITFYRDEGIRVSCDPTKMQQVFLNIIQNSLYAMTAFREEKGAGYLPCLKLSVAPGTSGRFLEITIEDNGPGMDKDIEKKIFDPFFTTKPPGVGTGLGLSISYYIVTRVHKGELKVATAPGQGACFTICLPIAAES
ncbi:MAG: transporter substrate-binding domain-containing protein [Desulfobacter sp.]|nr:MAG: transporter substrate-binding domain-containing protein [Desulfobacter sp.]